MLRRAAFSLSSCRFRLGSKVVLFTTGAAGAVGYKIHLDRQRDPEYQFKKVDDLLLEFSKDIPMMQKYATLGFEEIESREWMEKNREHVMKKENCYMTGVATMKFLEQKLKKKIVIKKDNFDELCRRITEQKFSVHAIYYIHTWKFFSGKTFGHVEVIVGHNGKFRVYQSSLDNNNASNNFTLQEYLQVKNIQQFNQGELIQYLTRTHKKSMWLSKYFAWGSLDLKD